ncbi:hypothetical protein GIB67_000364 [Kingdonia uniflora]|uniref:Malectin-like domain-containing protein n=1 Tax=Kingdonia uniflora TaxID=39325 RepID=A0A7J7LKE3_9MAGN|nr:hypothetical protein GIB67_000364 [Kingdonia uniflora]
MLKHHTLLLLLLLIHLLTLLPSSSSRKDPYALRISCGARDNTQTLPTNTIWFKDYGYTGGIPSNATLSSYISPPLKTLRYFPLSSGPEHCYAFNRIPRGHYNVRIFFGLLEQSESDNNEPLFDVSVQGTQIYELKSGWTSADDQAFTESLVFVRDGVVTICFHSTGHGDPSILSIEILQVDDKLYYFGPNWGEGVILRTAQRLSCGSGKPAFDADFNGDRWGGDRFWSQIKTFGENSDKAISVEEKIKRASVAPNFYPERLYRTAIVSTDAQPDLTYVIEVDPNRNYSVWLHFAEIDAGVKAEGERVFDVLINGDIAFQDVDIIRMSGDRYAALVLNNTVSLNGRSLTITLHPAKGNHAIINAIEVFEIIPAESRTSSEEVFRRMYDIIVYATSAMILIEEDEDGFVFKRGRDEFVRGNLLKFGDYLVYTYSGWFRFDVKLYDHKSSFGKELALLTNVDESNKEKIGDNAHVVSSSRESSGSSVLVIVSVDNDEGESRNNGQCSRMSGRCRNSVLKEMTDQTGQDDSWAKKTRKSDVFVQAESDSWENISDTRDDENVLWQVDVDMMEVFCTSLVEYLEIEDVYNILILNPKHNIKRQKYGYRRGLFEFEISFLKENKSLQTKILQSGNVKEKAFALDKIKRPLYEKHPMTKFTWTLSEDIDTLMNGKNEDMQLLLEKEFKSEKLAGVHAECLTDTWMGKNRWAFIDLSTGPFSWGPSVGGEGVRTKVSLPNVEKTIGAVAEIIEDEAEDHLMRDLKNELQSFEGEEYDEAHKRKAEEALKRMENWNLFSDTYEEFHNYTVAHDTFLAHLGATLWGSMRHIISPSVADGAFHYYETISFQLFFMTQEKVGHIKNLPVDPKALIDGLSSCLLQAQRPMFSSHMLPL